MLAPKPCDLVGEGKLTADDHPVECLVVDAQNVAAIDGQRDGLPSPVERGEVVEADPIERWIVEEERIAVDDAGRPEPDIALARCFRRLALQDLAERQDDIRVLDQRTRGAGDIAGVGEHIVTVDHHGELPGGKFVKQPLIIANPTDVHGIAAVDQPWIGQDASDNAFRAIGRGVVGDDDLEIWVGLGQRAAHACLDPCFLVVSGDQQRDLGQGGRRLVARYR